MIDFFFSVHFIKYSDRETSSNNMKIVIFLKTVRTHIHNQFCMKQCKLEIESLKSFLLLYKFSVPKRGSTRSVRGEKGCSWTQDADICQEMDEVCDDKV